MFIILAAYKVLAGYGLLSKPTSVLLWQLVNMMCALSFMQECKATLIHYICVHTSKLNSKQGL